MKRQKAFPRGKGIKRSWEKMVPRSKGSAMWFQGHTRTGGPPERVKGVTELRSRSPHKESIKLGNPLEEGKRKIQGWVCRGSKSRTAKGVKFTVPETGRV